MKIELLEQEIQYTFAGKDYKDNKMKRTMKNVKKDAQASDLINVGKALSRLHKDDGLIGATLVQHSDISIENAD